MPARLSSPAKSSKINVNKILLSPKRKVKKSPLRAKSKKSPVKKSPVKKSPVRSPRRARKNPLRSPKKVRKKLVRPKSPKRAIALPESVRTPTKKNKKKKSTKRGASGWNNAVKQARKDLNLKGFVAIKKGSALYKRAREIYDAN